MEKTYGNLLQYIKRIHDNYQQQANKMTQQNRQKPGMKIDAIQKNFMNKLPELLNNISILRQSMEKSQNIKGDMKKYVVKIRDCEGDLKSIVKKNSLKFKVNTHIEELLGQTISSIKSLTDNLSKCKDSTFLCCGTDGTAAYKKILESFSDYANQWRLLSSLQPKDSVQNFTSPKFNEKDYAFIKDQLKKNWPQAQIVQKIVKEFVPAQNNKTNYLALANQYIYGINRQHNVQHGLRVYMEQAEMNDTAACSFLGQVYEEGVLLPKDMKKALNYYKKAMEGKQPYASYRYALSLIRGTINRQGQNRNDIEKGYKILTDLQKSKNLCGEAMVELGSLYQDGYFSLDVNKLYRVDVNLKQAIKMYQLARKQFVPRAANNLGVLYCNNKSLNEASPNSKIQTENLDNFKKSVKYLQEAQASGYPKAFYNLGSIYERGFMTKKDTEKAMQLYYQGGSKGDISCKIRFAYALMNQTSIMKQNYEEHYKVALNWLNESLQILERKKKIGSFQFNQYQSASSVQKHISEALYFLGLMYEFGFGIDRNSTKSYNYFLQSANLNDPAAKNKIGDCYFSGFGVKQDRKLAIGCYLEAAQLNNPDAMVNLGTIYLNGIPDLIQRDYTKAHGYFCKAMDLDNSDAMIHLSYMYRNGLGTDQDTELAKKLLEQAAKNKNATALYMLKQQGISYDQRVLFEHVENEFFTSPKKLNISQIVPVLSHIK